MKEQDIVRVIKQPKNQIVQLIGEVGFITELNDKYPEHANIETLKLNDDCGGCGTVPLDCLEIVDDPKWIEAKKKSDEKKAKSLAESIAYSDRYKKRIANIAKKFGLSVKTIRDIQQELYSLEP